VTAPGGLRGRAERLLQEPAPNLAEILDLVSDRLGEVETMFRDNLASPVGIVREIGDFVTEGGGKRVRPTLHLLAADVAGYEGPHDVLMACVLEYIHSATLIHDDIIDEADVRRGRPSVNHRWGNAVTVLFGDWLLSKAMEMALRAGSLRIMEILSELTQRMVEGEMLQTRYAGRADVSREQYLDLIERKTAVLFGGCCETAGVMAGLRPDRCRALRRYGLNLGMAFQIVDDLLDLTGDSAVLGKPAASDLREGKTTLPVIDLLATGPARAQDLVRAIMTDGRSDGPETTELRVFLEEGGALERSRRLARQHAASAAGELGGFGPGPARRALESLPDLLIFRDR